MTAPDWRGAEIVEIAALTFDQRLFPRENLDEATVERYAALMADGAPFPPISVVRVDTDERFPTDGWHRANATKRIGRATISARIRDGTWDDVIESACTANAQNGLPLTMADQRKAIRMLLGLSKWARASDREIARRIGCSHHTVAGVRAYLGNLPAYEQPIENTEPDFSPPPERRVVQRGGQVYSITAPRRDLGATNVATGEKNASQNNEPKTTSATNAAPTLPDGEPPQPKPRAPRTPPSEADVIIKEVIARASTLSDQDQMKLTREWGLNPRPIGMTAVLAWGVSALDSELGRAMAAFFNRTRSNAEKAKFFYETVKPWIDAYERDNPDHEPCDEAREER